MFKAQVARQLARAARVQAPRAAFRPAISSARRFNTSVGRFDKQDDREFDAASSSGAPGESGDHEGQYARTREDIVVEYPDEKDLPPSNPVQGRGGPHYKPTLATFSMEGKTAVVTGGARGLGLVMAQALVTSGADVAIVDMNRDEAARSAEGLVELYKKENKSAGR
jgi:D-arabinitol 2-dehydrogenase